MKSACVRLPVAAQFDLFTPGPASASRGTSTSKAWALVELEAELAAPAHYPRHGRTEFHLATFVVRSLHFRPPVDAPQFRFPAVRPLEKRRCRQDQRSQPELDQRRRRDLYRSRAGRSTS